jgi:hypothetical protein
MAKWVCSGMIYVLQNLVVEYLSNLGGEITFTRDYPEFCALTW